MSKSVLAALLVTTSMFASAAHASVMNVKSVRITNSLNEFLQVAEFQAFQTGTGNNVALASAGAVATTTSGSWDANSTPSKAIDGAFDNLNFPNMYHNANGTVGNLTITFASSFELNSFTIYGRSDCCSNRDIYNVAFFDATNKLLYTASSVNATGATHSASVQLPEPAPVALMGLGLLGLLALRKRAS